MLDYNKLFHLLIEEAGRQRQVAEANIDYASVWTARMSACHVFHGLAGIVSKMEKEKSSNVIPLDRSVQ